MKKHPSFMLFVLLSFLSTWLHAASFDTAKYHDYKAMTKQLKSWAKKKKTIMTLDSQGTTIGGREVWSVTLSGTADPSQQPAALIVAGVEGVDVAASEMCLHFIHSIVTQYSKSDTIKQLLDQTTFYIFPRVNPDAAEAFFQKPLQERNYNLRPIDHDKDGLQNEDGFEDLNGDGLITMMRVADPSGELLADTKIPDLLRSPDHAKGEKSMYRLLTEGVDNDKDGLWNEDGIGGVSFNQNFTYNYSYFTKGAGTHQVSEVETRAVIDFAFAHSNIAAVFTFSPNENLIHPWKKAEVKTDKHGRPIKRHSLREPVDKVLPGDAPYYAEISKRFQKITGFDEAPASQAGKGAFSEWAYYHFGRWSFSTRAWWPPLVETTQDSIDDDKNSSKNSETPPKSNLNDKERLWYWTQAVGMKDAFVPWTSFKHPDFPDQQVEIGGFRPFIGINPPADSLALRGKKFSTFLVQLGQSMPRLKVVKRKVQHLHSNTYRIELTVKNTGYFPTITELGERSQWNPKVKAVLKLEPEHLLLSGRTLTFFKPIPGNTAGKTLRWLIRGKQGSRVQLSIGSPMTGIQKLTFELK